MIFFVILLVIIIITDKDVLASDFNFNAVSTPPYDSGDHSYDNVSSSRHNAITRSVERVSPAVVGINVTQVQRYYTNNPFLNDPFFRHFFQDLPTREERYRV